MDLRNHEIRIQGQGTTQYIFRVLIKYTAHHHRRAEPIESDGTWLQLGRASREILGLSKPLRIQASGARLNQNKTDRNQGLNIIRSNFQSMTVGVLRVIPTLLIDKTIPQAVIRACVSVFQFNRSPI